MNSFNKILNIFNTNNQKKLLFKIIYLFLTIINKDLHPSIFK